jgi:hypothetical protein
MNVLALNRLERVGHGPLRSSRLGPVSARAEVLQVLAEFVGTMVASADGLFEESTRQQPATTTVYGQMS